MFRKGKTCITTKFHRTDIVICSHSRERETPSYSGINTVQEFVSSDGQDTVRQAILFVDKFSFIICIII